MNWTIEIIDDVLEAVLPLNSERQYKRALILIADKYDIGDADIPLGDRLVHDGDPVNRALWGFATRVRDYTVLAGGGALTGANTTSRRTRRGGQLTWMEQRILTWALTGESDQRKARPDASYLAALLGRDVEEVRREMNRLGPARGRRGFFDSPPSTTSG